MICRFAALFLCVWSQLSVATTVAWVELVPVLDYRDLSVACTTDGYFSHFLGAELQGSRVKAAVLKSGGMDAFYRGVTFEQEELKELSFGLDSKDRIWVTGLGLSSRLLRWVMENSGGALGGCTPAQSLTSVSPEGHLFHFQIDSLGAGPVATMSDLGRFSGKRKDGRYYQAKLQFVQKQLRKEVPLK